MIVYVLGRKLKGNNYYTVQDAYSSLSATGLQGEWHYNAIEGAWENGNARAWERPLPDDTKLATVVWQELMQLKPEQHKLIYFGVFATRQTANEVFNRLSELHIGRHDLSLHIEDFLIEPVQQMADSEAVGKWLREAVAEAKAGKVENND